MASHSCVHILVNPDRALPGIAQMSKRLAEAAFDVVCQHMLTSTKRQKTDEPLLDTYNMQRVLRRARNQVEHILPHVRHRDLEYSTLFYKVAAYLGQDPVDCWYSGESDTVGDFVYQLCGDLRALASHVVEWRIQGRLATISPNWRRDWRTVPRHVVKSWLGQDSDVEGQVRSDALFQVSELLGGCDGLYELASFSDNDPPPTIMDIPTGLSDTESETDGEDETDDE